MKNLILLVALPFTLIFVTSCQTETSQAESNEQAEIKKIPQEPAKGGIINTGEWTGKEMTIAMGDEMEKMMQVIEAFNKLDATGAWKYSADSVPMLGSSGGTQYLTEEAMAGYFESLETISWNVNKMIPIQVDGTNSVIIIIDSTEEGVNKDGSTFNVDLLEEFIWEDGKMVAVRQWNRDIQM